MPITIGLLQEARARYYESTGEHPRALVTTGAEWKQLEHHLEQARFYVKPQAGFGFPGPVTILGMRIFLKPTLSPGVVILCRGDGTLPGSPFRVFS